MSKVLLDLQECQITDCGEVLFKHDAIVDLLRRHQSMNDLVALYHEDIRFSNQRHPEKPIQIANITGEPESLPARCYEFTLPAYYLDIDIHEYVSAKLVEKRLVTDVYIERIILELQMMADRGMLDFVKALIYIIEVFEENSVVHGVGRGSSCCSLVLYLIGVHLVDPIQYDLAIDEFLR